MINNIIDYMYDKINGLDIKIDNEKLSKIKKQNETTRYDLRKQIQVDCEKIKKEFERLINIELEKDSNNKTSNGIIKGEKIKMTTRVNINDGYLFHLFCEPSCFLSNLQEDISKKTDMDIVVDIEKYVDPENKKNEYAIPYLQYKNFKGFSY